MTRPKVPDDKRQRTAQACDSCKRRKQKVGAFCFFLFSFLSLSCFTCSLSIFQVQGHGIAPLDPEMSVFASVSRLSSGFPWKVG